MRISNFRRIDTTSFPGLYISVVEVSSDSGEGMSEAEVSNILHADKDAIDGIMFRGADRDILDFDGLHRFIRAVRPVRTKSIVDTCGRNTPMLDDLIGAGYVTGVSFEFDRYPDKHQIDSLDIARNGDCRFAVTIRPDPERFTMEDISEMNGLLDGAFLVIIRKPETHPGAKQYRKNELVSLAKSLKGRAREVRVC